MRATIAVFCVFLGCCSNVVFLELFVKDDPGGGNLITFSQFLFISIEGFIFTSKCGNVKPRIGLKDYLVMVTMFFIANVCNNYAFDFNIPMPLHMIFRAGSLIANMIMCVIVSKKSYTFSKYLSVIMITFGIAICTLISGKDIKSLRGKNVEHVPTTPWEDFFWWALGISLMTVALLVSARMGILQEELHKKYGKNPKEALYYTHLLPLPFFLTLAPNIWDHFTYAVNSEPLRVSMLDIYVPKLILFLIGNVLTQYVCISSVYVLTAECSSLTVTLVITLRKFVSLLFSIVYFRNPFTIYHWFGTVLVFVGTVIFTEVVPKIKESLKIKEKKKVQ
ncbi:ER GDP-fucose transporter [Megalopta genalis]|uniref:ER GDP-fucose transporter n=1 Tax=Megalopta genalis TaxID=115081 RepID=UPI00144335A0|nr:UDP-xylose and UDP-N-acetylglucosamine transporter [Megalopta genalis]